MANLVVGYSSWTSFKTDVAIVVSLGEEVNDQRITSMLQTLTLQDGKLSTVGQRLFDEDKPLLQNLFRQAVGVFKKSGNNEARKVLKHRAIVAWKASTAQLPVEDEAKESCKERAEVHVLEPKKRNEKVEPIATEIQHLNESLQDKEQWGNFAFYVESVRAQITSFVETEEKKLLGIANEIERREKQKNYRESSREVIGSLEKVIADIEAMIKQSLRLSHSEVAFFRVKLVDLKTCVARLGKSIKETE